MFYLNLFAAFKSNQTNNNLSVFESTYLYKPTTFNFSDKSRLIAKNTTLLLFLFFILSSSLGEFFFNGLFLESIPLESLSTNIFFDKSMELLSSPKLLSSFLLTELTLVINFLIIYSIYLLWRLTFN